MGKVLGGFGGGVMDDGVLKGDRRMPGGGGDGNLGDVTKGSVAKEAELLRRLLADDAAAWRELVALYSGLLMAVSKRTFKGYRMLGTQEDHEDVVAAVWENFLEDDRRLVNQCLEKENLGATLHLLTKRRAVDLIRKKGVRAQVGGEDGELLMGELEAPQAQVMGEAQEEKVEEKVSPETLAAAMEQLSERQRMLVRLFYLQNKAYKEIEALTGVAQNSIGPTIKRAMEKLREVLKKG